MSLNYTSVLAGLIGYVGLCSLLRYRVRDGFYAKYPYKTKDDFKKMTNKDAWEIQQRLMGTEFPFTYEKALQFALFKTYGIPTISKLLVKTKQFSDTRFAGKRYVDTEILIAEFLSSPPDSQRANDATARMNYIHSIYQKQGHISNDDLLYTLALFVLEPITWVKQYEWREFTDLELCAIGTFWKSQGQAMGISFDALSPCKSGLEFVDALAIWSEDYEKRCMVPDLNNKNVADETTKLLLYDIPQFARSSGVLAISALLTHRLRAAMMYPVPPAALVATIQATLKLRKYILRWLALPRPWALRKRKVMDDPDSKGRLYAIEYVAEPWYMEPTLWNSWGALALFKRISGKPVPGIKYSPGGYVTSKLGPKIAETEKKEEHEAAVKHLLAQKRGGCPFGYT